MTNPKSLLNLKPNTERTKEELRTNGRKGGIASGKVRKERKTLQETLIALLNIERKDGSTNMDALAIALLKKALSGNVEAIRTIRDSIGESKMQVSMGFEDVPEGLGALYERMGIVPKPQNPS